MNQRESDVKECLALLKGLFPSITKDQLVLVGEKLPHHPKLRSLAVIKTHGANHEFFSMPALVEGLAASAAKFQDSFCEKERIVDFILRTNPRPPGEHVDHAAAIMGHFAAAWEGVKQKRADGSEQVRRLILGHCRMALMEIGWTEPDAKASARDVVGLVAGEQIGRPFHLRGAA